MPTKRCRCGLKTLVSLSEEAEDKAVELIARYQPVASDLRKIKSYMKMAYDLNVTQQIHRNI